MRIWIGADHRGRDYREFVKEILTGKGHEVRDLGTFSEGPADYPDLAIPVARAVRDGEADRGVLICATGIGMSMTANRLRGVRATLCITPEMAATARRHNDSNVLCLARDLSDREQTKAIVETWLETEFDGGRHSRRLGKMDHTAS